MHFGKLLVCEMHPLSAVYVLLLVAVVVVVVAAVIVVVVVVVVVVVSTFYLFGIDVSQYISALARLDR